MNKVIIIGRLGKDPELRYMPNGKAVAIFSIATSEKWTGKDGEKQERTEWHNIVAFEKTAELCAGYLNKGSQAAVEGKIQTRSWEKDGEKKYKTEIVVNRVEFLGSKVVKEDAPAEAPADDEEVPF